jgi:hypothetical protein
MLLILLIFSACRNPEQTPAAKEGDPAEEQLPSEVKYAAARTYQFSHLSGDTIFFTHGQYYKTHLYETGFIGMVNVGDKAPYLIYSGRDCNECDANLSLYIHSPDDGTLDVSDGQYRMIYPGKVFHYETGELIYESNAFYGEVVNGTRGLIYYTGDFSETGDTLKRTLLIRLDAAGMTDSMWNHHLTLNQTIRLEAAGLCHEIAIKDFTSEP